MRLWGCDKLTPGEAVCFGGYSLQDMIQVPLCSVVKL